jgi:glutaredoxin
VLTIYDGYTEIKNVRRALMTNKDIILYTIIGCTKCQAVQRYLKENKITFTEVNVMEQPERFHEVVELIGEFYAPVLVYGQTVLKEEIINKLESMKLF